MPMQPFTDEQVEKFLREAGAYRVRRAQIIAAEGEPDGISGSLILAMGLRETHIKNVEGGARKVNGVYVREDRPEFKDVGFIQINRHWHNIALGAMPAVKAGTWGPVVPGKTPLDDGHCPRFEDSLRYVLSLIHENIAFGVDHFVNGDDLPRFAVAAHNAGPVGALDGYRHGDVDKNTAMSDYSAWVFRTRSQVNKFLVRNANWRIS